MSDPTRPANGDGALRIAYITSSLPFGPKEAFILPEIREWRRQGHEVLIVPMWPRGAVVHEEASSLLESTIREPLGSWAIARGALRAARRHPLRALACLVSLLGAPHPRLLAKNLAIFPKGLWLANLAEARRLDHLHAHWAATTATMAMLAGEVSGVPWSFTAHRWDLVENNLLGRKLRHARFARFISLRSLGLLAQHGLSPPRTAEVLHMGVELPETAPAPLGGDRQPVVICPANLIRFKGHGYLLEAIARLRDQGTPVALWLAGDGEMRSELEAQVAALRLGEAVRFLGQLPHQALLALYQAQRIDLLVMPSLEVGSFCEGIPVAALEAMAFGIPVVVTRTGGMSELVSEGTGLQVPQRDAEALAEAIGALARNPDLRRRLGAAGRRRVQAEFAIAHVVAELADRLQVKKGAAS